MRKHSLRSRSFLVSLVLNSKKKDKGLGFSEALVLEMFAIAAVSVPLHTRRIKAPVFSSPEVPRKLSSPPSSKSNVVPCNSHNASPSSDERCLRICALLATNSTLSSPEHYYYYENWARNGVYDTWQLSGSFPPKQDSKEEGFFFLEGVGVGRPKLLRNRLKSKLPFHCITTDPSLTLTPTPYTSGE